mmetsp:Transcript_26244/g.46281  ORF Transcript_26244/g.46281 Transcript_26244/m.46281 type:complete len:317 (+) Transcript_26244:161-1111(+)
MCKSDSEANGATANVENNSNNSTTNTSLNKFNILNFLAYLVNVFITFAIGTFGLAGRPTNGELSAKYQTIVTPNGLAFSIWALIFILQAIWVLWQILLPQQRNAPAVYKVSWLYVGVCLAQCAWTIVFSYEIIWLSLVCMLTIAAFLVAAVYRLQTVPKRLGGYLIWQLPLSLHCGWILAASVVNTNVVPVFYNATTTVQLVIAYASLAVLFLIELAWLLPYPVDFAVPCVFIWALGGVYLELQQPSTMILETFTESQVSNVQTTCLALMVAVGAAIVIKLLYVLLVQRPKAVAAATESSENQQTNADSKPNEDNV